MHDQSVGSLALHNTKETSVIGYERSTGPSWVPELIFGGKIAGWAKRNVVEVKVQIGHLLWLGIEKSWSLSNLYAVL